MIETDGKEYCVDPAGGVVGVLGKAWSLPLIGVLGNRPVSRFNELQDAVGGIGTKVLAQRLSELSELGLISRTVYPQVPVRVEYSLTPAGSSLRRALVPLLAWATQHPPPPGGRAGGRAFGATPPSRSDRAGPP